MSDLSYEFDRLTEHECFYKLKTLDNLTVLLYSAVFRWHFWEHVCGEFHLQSEIIELTHYR